MGIFHFAVWFKNNFAEIYAFIQDLRTHTAVISSSQRRIEIVISWDDDISKKSDKDETKTLPDL